MPRPEDEPKSETLEQRIRDMMPAMTEQVAAQIRAEALRKLEYTVADAIATEVKNYVAEFLIPHVRNELVAREVELRAVLLASVSEMTVALGAKIIEGAKSKLASYSGDEIVKDLMQKWFGRGY